MKMSVVIQCYRIMQHFTKIYETLPLSPQIEYNLSIEERRVAHQLYAVLNSLIDSAVDQIHPLSDQLLLDAFMNLLNTINDQYRTPLDESPFRFPQYEECL